MRMIKINVRKEVVRCDKCKRVKDFIYLSDFAYGQRLVFFNEAKECAFENLIEDVTFEEYKKIVKGVLKENKIEFTENCLNGFVNSTFGITCDKINGYDIDFSKDQKVCAFCGSVRFERNMIEPESIIEINVPVISHIGWENLLENEKQKMIKEELKKKGLI